MAPAAVCGSLTSTPQETENWRRGSKVTDGGKREDEETTID